MRRIWRWLAIAAASLLGLFGIIVAAVAVWFWLSTPQLNGTVAVPGNDAQVEILRDENGVPHIFATTPNDAYFGLGFVHAQDRLFQIEQQRRLAQGRLSELMGSSTLRIDKFFRLLNLTGYAEQNLDGLNDDTRQALNAYAAGVNAYLASRHGATSPELTLLMADHPEPWRPADTIAWLKVMALHLSGNWREEVLRARLIETIGEERTREFFPPHPPDAPIIIDDALRTSSLTPAPWRQTLLDLLPRTLDGSNNWVVDGSMTATGMPLLANDPHLGLAAPAIWYMAHLEAPGLSVVGATLPGIPAIIVGHNSTAAWGVTNTRPDTQDLFVERIDPDDPDRYLTPHGSAAFTERDETIAVRFGSDETVTIRETRHGPVISDIYGEETEGIAGDGEVIALAWTMLSADDRSIQSALAAHSVRSWEEFVAVARDYRGPQQNIVYADTSGRIGLYAPAVVPIRSTGQGLAPVPGWTGEYDWIGEIPFDDLPHVVDPPRRNIVSANEKIVGDDYLYFLAASWQPGYRSRRIRDLLEKRDDHDVDSFAAIQLDNRSLMAADFLTFALAAEPQTEAGRSLRNELAGWQGDMEPDLVQPLVFSAWYRELTRLIYENDLGESFSDAWWHRATFTRAVLQGSLDHWCDNPATEAKETCDDLTGQAFDLAAKFLTERYGDDVTGWSWGRAHEASFGHRLFQYVPLVSGLTGRRLPVGGDPFTVNTGSYIFSNDDAVFTSVHGASMRAIFDLDDLDKSRYVWAPGQSGHIFSPYYDNMLVRWRDNDMVTIPSRRNLIDVAHTLVLEPSTTE